LDFGLQYKTRKTRKNKFILIINNDWNWGFPFTLARKQKMNSFYGNPTRFPVFGRNGWAETCESHNGDRSGRVEQKLSYTQNSQRPPSGRFRSLKGRATQSCPSPARIEALLYRAEIFFAVTRTQSGCVCFLFFEK